jgi:hypothetical protein
MQKQTSILALTPNRLSPTPSRGYIILKTGFPTKTPCQNRYTNTFIIPLLPYRAPRGFFATGLIQLTATLMPITIAPMM